MLVESQFIAISLTGISFELIPTEKPVVMTRKALHSKRDSGHRSEEQTKTFLSSHSDCSSKSDMLLQKESLEPPTVHFGWI